jgi:hypothetical protein
MWKLEAGGLLFPRTLPFYHFFIQIVETSSGGMWKLEAGGLLFARSLPFYQFLFRSWRRLAEECGSLDQEVFSLQGLRQYFQVIFFTRFAMCYW